MREMDALTELELAAARRREVMLEDRAGVRAHHKVERRDGHRDLGSLAATARLALGSRLARS
jgi:hypothetical protein